MKDAVSQQQLSVTNGTNSTCTLQEHGYGVIERL